MNAVYFASIFLFWESFLSCLSWLENDGRPLNVVIFMQARSILFESGGGGEAHPKNLDKQKK